MLSPGVNMLGNVLNTKYSLHSGYMRENSDYVRPVGKTLTLFVK